MKKLLTLLALCAFTALAQTTTTAPPPSTSPGEFLIHAGMSTDFVSHQPSAVTGFSYQVATIGGMPTYWATTFETGLIKTPGTSNSLTLTTGFLQIPYHQAHWGLYYFSQAGVLKFDAATLGTLNGGGGVYVDVGGLATKDKYHVWLSGGPRQLSIASLENKVNWLIELTTVLKKSQ